MRRPNIEDVAQLAGVSIKTVSRVLNEEPHVRPGTRDKVNSAVEQLSYKPHMPARQLASRQSFLVGMVYDSPNASRENDYVNALQVGALRTCAERGYKLLINPCRASAHDLHRDVTELIHQVDGLILLQPLSDELSLMRMLLEERVPCVRVSQRPFAGFPWISVGDVKAADSMTEHLLQQGHRRIGFILGHPDHGQSHDRLAGYQMALKRHGIPFDKDLVQPGQFDFESGYTGGRKLISAPEPPTAIFASNDAMAMGVLSAAHEFGLDIPGQLSVAGFDDSPLARHAWPQLTTVRQPVEEVARLATEELIKTLRKFDPADHHICLEAELVCRASTGPAPARQGDDPERRP